MPRHLALAWPLPARAQPRPARRQPRGLLVPLLVVSRPAVVEQVALLPVVAALAEARAVVVVR